MATLVDKRKFGKDKAALNRHKFMKRYKEVIKANISNIITRGSIKDFSFKDKKITLEKSLSIPWFSFDGDQSVQVHINSGNDRYKTGDRISKDLESITQALSRLMNGDGDEGTDDFDFLLTQDEFMDLFFEELALPDMLKQSISNTVPETRRCGYSNTGSPSSLNVRKTITNSIMRRMALEKEEERKELLVEEGDEVRKKKAIPFIDDFDLRYNHRDKVDVPISKAVMFCLMDVSGSMGEKEKGIAKRFFILLKLFLECNYDKVDIVFIRHAEWAEECSEAVFFNGRESGGTLISSGYKVILDVISQRYPTSSWNVYICQATDGDNFESNSIITNMLSYDLLPLSQYFAFIEIISNKARESELFEDVKDLSKSTKNLAVASIKDYNQIWEVFKGLFERSK